MKDGEEVVSDGSSSSTKGVVPRTDSSLRVLLSSWARVGCGEGKEAAVVAGMVVAFGGWW